jgi:predicted NBD/HSP70 family sugar kinase
VRFNTELGHVSVTDLGATSIDVAATKIDDRILAHRSEEADIAAGPEPILGRVQAFFDELAASAETTGVLWGIGGVPGSVDFSTARPVSPILPGLDDYGIQELLRTATVSLVPSSRPH